MSTPYDDPRQNHLLPQKPLPPSIPYETYHALSPEENPEDCSEEHGEEGRGGQNEKRSKKRRGQEWPSTPQQLERWRSSGYIVCCFDLFLTLLPLMFLVFAACAISLDEKPLSGFGSNIRAGARLGPTIFPIVFAAVVARLMRGVALRRAERGSRLGLLEQLNGSQSLAGAIERFILLRRYTLIGCAIIILWSLSPLGGQSSLRILDITNMDKRSDGLLHYFNTTSTLGSSPTAFGTADDYDGPSMMALLQASLLEPDSITDSPVDTWNNVKIPRLSAMSPFADTAPNNPWILFGRTRDTIWSSLSGLMIQGIPAAGISRFTVESSYFDLECSDCTQFELEDPSSSGEGYSRAFETDLLLHNKSWPFTAPGGSHNASYIASQTSSFFLDSDTPLSWWSPRSYTPLTLLYGSKLDGSRMDLYNCSLGISRVESAIVCEGPLCEVKGMRRSKVDTRSPFDVPFNNGQWSRMLRFLPFATGTPHPATPAALDQYMLGSRTPLAAGSRPVLPSFAEVPGHIFASRLTTILNTVWQASLAPNSVSLGASANYSAAFAEFGHFPSANTTAVISEAVPVYSANYLFISLLLVATLILQVCALSGLVLKYTAIAPDILGHISTMTRDNPHVNVPKGGNTLDGLERAIYLYDKKFQLGDTEWNQNEGHIALRSVNSDSEFRRGRVSRDRWYI